MYRGNYLRSGNLRADVSSSNLDYARFLTMCGCENRAGVEIVRKCYIVVFCCVRHNLGIRGAVLP